MLGKAQGEAPLRREGVRYQCLPAPLPSLGALYFSSPFSSTCELKLNDLGNPASQLGLCLLSPKIADEPPRPPGFYAGARDSHSSPLVFAARAGPLSYFRRPWFVL